MKQLKLKKWVDGKSTAGWHAKVVKNNTQVSDKDPELQEIKQRIKKILFNNLLFRSVVQPKKIHHIKFSRYQTGMYYGDHVDNALMGNNFERADLSFTLFLSSPDSYQGGELIIDTFESLKYKLSAGSIVIYPSTTLHRIEPVTQGERLVVIGWVQSLVRDNYKREILFDLDSVRRSIFARDGKTTEFDLLSKTHANLLRLWSE